jgi:23S rRNA pseudouridine1911/1915/1917 synthase
MKRYQTRVPGSVTKERLDLYLFEWLPHAVGTNLTKAQVRTLIASGSVYVNRHRNKIASAPIFTGAMIEVYFDEEKLNKNQPSRMGDGRFDANRIVFEDDYLIVVNKPSGLPTQPTIDPNRANLFDLLKRMIAHRDKVEDPYVGLHHRLDKDTSGLVLFTKKEIANKGVADLFSEHRIQKTYQCVCWRSPQARVLETNEEFRIENYLGKVSEGGGKARFGAVRSGGDLAITDFRAVEVFRDMYWLQARPKTGRTHQIRVHTSEAMMPILGDELYFPEKIATFISAPRLMLHAAELQFIHPISQEQMSLGTPLPEEFVEVLGRLKA